VIKTYVRLGLGIGIVAEMAVRDDPQRRPGGAPGGPPVWPERGPRGLQARRLPAQLCLQFAELLSDRLDRKLIARAMDGHVNAMTGHAGTTTKQGHTLGAHDQYAH
jgi:LysR family cys regulon transcriptional activator